VTSGRGKRGLLLTALLLASLVGLTNWIYTRSLLDTHRNQSLQSRTNRNFALESRSLVKALESYPGVWPPLYPMTLRAASESGVPIERVNEVLFFVSLAWIFWWVRRRVPEIHWGWPLLFLCLATFNYEVMSQLVPENLFVPLSFLVLSAIGRYGDRPTWGSVVALSVACAAACATKYIALFWLLPIAGMQILLAGPFPRRTRIAQLGGFGLISVLPVGVWMGYQYGKTGFLTGIDRFASKEAAAGNEDLITLGGNIWLAGKSLVLDFFSLSHSADHATVNHPYPPDGGLYVFAGLIVVVLISNRQQIRSLVSGTWEAIGRSVARDVWMMAGAVVYYWFVLVALWTVGNNDPIYSRFVYPVYPFLVILGFAGYGAVRRKGAGLWGRLAFWAFYATLILVHAYKTIVLQHVVHTPAWS